MTSIMSQLESSPCEHDWIAMAAGDMPNHAGWEIHACCRRCGLTARIPLGYGMILRADIREHRNTDHG